MGNYLRLHIHLIWSTKHRRPYLTAEIRRRLFPYLAATLRGQRGGLRAIGGWVDHVHLYAEFPSYLSVGQLVSVLKSRSCRWLRMVFPQTTPFRWQRGYAAFSVDPRHSERLIRYIHSQEQHHSRTPYLEEFTAIVESYGLDAADDPGD